MQYLLSLWILSLSITKAINKKNIPQNNQLYDKIIFSVMHIVKKCYKYNDLDRQQLT